MPKNLISNELIHIHYSLKPQLNVNKMYTIFPQSELNSMPKRSFEMSKNKWTEKENMREKCLSESEELNGRKQESKNQFNQQEKEEMEIVRKLNCLSSIFKQLKHLRSQKGSIQSQKILEEAEDRLLLIEREIIRTAQAL